VSERVNPSLYRLDLIIQMSTFFDLFLEKSLVMMDKVLYTIAFLEGS